MVVIPIFAAVKHQQSEVQKQQHYPYFGTKITYKTPNPRPLCRPSSVVSRFFSCVEAFRSPELITPHHSPNSIPIYSLLVPWMAPCLFFSINIPKQNRVLYRFQYKNSDWVRKGLINKHLFSLLEFSYSDKTTQSKRLTNSPRGCRYIEQYQKVPLLYQSNIWTFQQRTPRASLAGLLEPFTLLGFAGWTWNIVRT